MRIAKTSFAIPVLLMASAASCAPVENTTPRSAPGSAPPVVSVADNSPCAKSLSELRQDFRTYDKDGKGNLSMEEFEALGKDDLAFRAADLDSDGQVDASEFIQYCEAKAADKERSP